MNPNRKAGFTLGLVLCLGTVPCLAVDVLTEPSLRITPDHYAEDAALSPDGTRVVAVGRGLLDGHNDPSAQVTLWDADTGELIRILAQPYRFNTG
ncbi:MAG: hypothetical protein H7A47_14845 [Verrucomicrobiales bacterium]|nr:hypothetical protein [Verrucomicrobiales bacterium]